jgi:polyhydroxyalkanoate synthase
MKNQLDYLEISAAFTDLNNAGTKDTPALNTCCQPLNHTMLEVSRAVNLFKSRGQSLAQGIQNWVRDLQKGDRFVTLADPKAFTVGENIATTPGAVVYRNQLVEIIQYAPQTENTWQIPIVLIQPWINKYYIFDLRPQNSLVRYLVRQGFTVFITRWKNPTAQMRHVDFEDYMLQGALQAITIAEDICNSKRVHAAGYSTGGTLLASLLAWLTHNGTCEPVIDATLFATLLDFSAPGDLNLLISPKSLAGIIPMYE